MNDTPGRTRPSSPGTSLTPLSMTATVMPVPSDTFHISWALIFVRWTRGSVSAAAGITVPALIAHAATRAPAALSHDPCRRMLPRIYAPLCPCALQSRADPPHHTVCPGQHLTLRELQRL